MLPLWLGSCSLPPGASPVSTAVQPGGLPAPQPLPAPFLVTTSTAAALAESAPATAASSGPETAASGPTAAAPSGPAAKPRAADSIEPQAGANGGAAATMDGSATDTLPAAGGRAAPESLAPGGTPVYFVAVDDGGSTGVRFGCNDSLVAVLHSPAAAEEPLRTSLAILLGGGNPPEGLYNSLDNSALKYLSAYFDGTTVVVHLTGTLRPGGTCDIPRLEAQLTHTAVSAVGAARAEIYIDGRRLADILSLR